MKIVKKGTIENGKLIGWSFDCEGGPIDLTELNEFFKQPSLREKPIRE